MSAVVELFGRSVSSRGTDWQTIVHDQHCPFLGKRCFKIRKSDPETSIGSCTVLYGKKAKPILICPARLLERGQIFTDCLHLLTLHEPGNELHVVPEVRIPGGSIDYFLVSARDGRVMDFAGIELQTMDTTGTVWPQRQRLLKNLGVLRGDRAEHSAKGFGMNWKMTAKTILVQMHHKIETFEHAHKKLVLLVQDVLLDYMAGAFDFEHLSNPALYGHSMHLHAYRVTEQANRAFRLDLAARLSTDAAGIGKCLDLQAEARLGLPGIIQILQAKIGEDTLFTPARSVVYPMEGIL